MRGVTWRVIALLQRVPLLAWLIVALLLLLPVYLGYFVRALHWSGGVEFWIPGRYPP